MVVLRPMTEAEYGPYMLNLRANYALERSKIGGTPLEEERIASDRQLYGLLPNGLATPNNYFWSVVNEDGTAVGVLWVQYSGQRAFIYDIEMHEDQRGKGYGEATLTALDAELRAQGVQHIGLSVIAANETARRLYERAGYYPIGIQMQRDL